MTQGQGKDQVMVSIGPVTADELSVKPDVSPPAVTASLEHRLAVPQPGTNVRNGRPISQIVQTSQPQDTAHVRVVQSSVETQTSN